MLRNKRRQLGFLIGEAAQCALMALGMMLAAAIVLNGFDLMATAHFVGNFTTRMTEAEGARADHYVRALIVTVSITAALIAAIRMIDRAVQKRRAV